MPVTATHDAGPEVCDELEGLLEEFGVKKEQHSSVVASRDAVTVIAAAKWLKKANPGFRSRKLMRRIADLTGDSKHTTNMVYLETNKNAIPELPFEIVKRQEIGVFFTTARDILDSGDPVRYLRIGKNPTK